MGRATSYHGSLCCRLRVLADVAPRSGRLRVSGGSGGLICPNSHG